jgi:hypothetical protein
MTKQETNLLSIGDIILFIHPGGILREGKITQFSPSKDFIKLNVMFNGYYLRELWIDSFYIVEKLRT